MILSNDEMLFLNSIQGGEAIFGVELKKPLIEDQAYLEKTIVGLKERGFIDEGGYLKEELLEPGTLLERYKSADCHIYLNTMKIALQDGNRLIVIVQEGECYELMACKTWEFLYVIFSQSDILNENLNCLILQSEKTFEVDDLMRAIERGNYMDGSIVQKYWKGVLIEDYVFCWTNMWIDAFDGMKKEKRKMAGNQARRLLLEIFELSLEGGGENE